MEPTASMALRAARKAGDLIVRASDDMDRIGYQAKAAADFVRRSTSHRRRKFSISWVKLTPIIAFYAKKVVYLGIRTLTTPG